MVAHEATQDQLRQEQLAQTVARCAAMPSQHDQVQYLRAQLAHREAQLEQVCAERDNHFIQEEEEVLAHRRLLSSEAKDWKSRVVSEADQVLCQESAQAAHQATEVQEAMDKQSHARWQAEAELQDLCKSSSAQAQALAAKLQDTQLEHQQKYTAHEAQALKLSQDQEQQAYNIAQEHE